MDPRLLLVTKAHGTLLQIILQLILIQALNLEDCFLKLLIMMEQEEQNISMLLFF